ncbi:MAG: ABC transporter substrate-binding protein [Thermoanaerobaculia bacterium]
MTTPTRHPILLRLSTPLVAALLVLPAACGSAERDRVGVVLPLSGQAKVYGRSLRGGAVLAWQELAQQAEAAGEDGPAFELDVRDSSSHPQRAFELATELYDGGAVAVIGGATDAEVRAMVPAAERVRRVLLSPSASSASLAGRSRYVFRLSPSSHQQAVKMGSFAALSLDLSKVGILMPGTDAGRELGATFAEAFEHQGGEVLQAVGYPQDPKEAGRLVEQVLEPRPEGVYLAASGADETARHVLRELARRGFRGTVMTTSAFAAPRLLSRTGHGTEGLVLSASPFDPDSQDPQVRAFVEAYRAEHGTAPDLYAAHGYDAVMALARAMEGEDGSSREPWEGLRSLSGYRGVTGVIQFDEQGNVGQFPRVWVVEEGRLHELAPDGAKRSVARADRRGAPRG